MMGIESATQLGCNVCAQLKEEYVLKFGTLKKKIIATNLLLKKFNEKNDECVALSKRFEDSTVVVERLQRDCTKCEDELCRVLGELEPLRKDNARLTAEIEECRRRSTELQLQVEAAEKSQQQFAVALRLCESERNTVRDELKAIRSELAVSVRKGDDLRELNKIRKQYAAAVRIVLNFGRRLRSKGLLTRSLHAKLAKYESDVEGPRSGDDDNNKDDDDDSSDVGSDNGDFDLADALRLERNLLDDDDIVNDKKDKPSDANGVVTADARLSPIRFCETTDKHDVALSPISRSLRDVGTTTTTTTTAAVRTVDACHSPMPRDMETVMPSTELLMDVVGAFSDVVKPLSPMPPSPKGHRCKRVTHATESESKATTTDDLDSPVNARAEENVAVETSECLSGKSDEKEAPSLSEANKCGRRKDIEGTVLDFQLQKPFPVDVSRYPLRVKMSTQSTARVTFYKRSPLCNQRTVDLSSDLMSKRKGCIELAFELQVSLPAIDEPCNLLSTTVPVTHAVVRVQRDSRTIDQSAPPECGSRTKPASPPPPPPAPLACGRCQKDSILLEKCEPLTATTSSDTSLAVNSGKKCGNRNARQSLNRLAIRRRPPALRTKVRASPKTFVSRSATIEEVHKMLDEMVMSDVLIRPLSPLPDTAMVSRTSLRLKEKLVSPTVDRLRPQDSGGTSDAAVIPDSSSKLTIDEAMKRLEAAGDDASLCERLVDDMKVPQPLSPAFLVSVANDLVVAMASCQFDWLPQSIAALKCRESAMPSPLSPTETRCLMLVHALHTKYGVFEDVILSATLQQLFTLNNEPKRTMTGPLCLCRFYVASCHRRFELDRARLLCYDLMYDAFNRCGPFVVSALAVWPLLLTDDDSHLVRVMRTLLVVRHDRIGFETTTTTMVDDWPRKLLVDVCGFDGPVKSDVDGLLATLLADLNEDSQRSGGWFEAIKSLELLSRVEGWEWTNDVLIRKRLWPSLRKWCSDQRDDEVADSTVAHYVCLLGHLGRQCPVESGESVAAMTKAMRGLLSESVSATSTTAMPLCVQEAACKALIMLLPADGDATKKAVGEWISTNGNRASPEVAILVANRLAS